MKSLIDFFLTPSSYPEKVKEIKHYETHISHVFLTDRFVYKIKKPVKFEFLDYSTLKKRFSNCKREVLLNSRLAKGYYLGVVKIYEKNNRLSFKKEKNSKIIEYAVKMKKIDEEKILANLIEGGENLYKDMFKIGKRVATFHRETPSYRGVYYGGYSAVLKDNRENFEEIEPFVGKTITLEEFATIKSFTENFLKENKTLLKKRKLEGFVKELHGDLQAHHVVLSKPLIVFDCIEFNKRLATGDVLEDIAFLVMDMEFRGRFDLSKILVKSYFYENKEFLNFDLLQFYKVYRAVVRGKVESLTSLSVAKVEDQEKAIKRAKNYFALASHYIAYDDKCFNPLIFMGFSGSGKSTVAKEFTDRAVLLRSDVIRKEIAGVNGKSHKRYKINNGIYSREMTEKTYTALLQKTCEALREGKRVIVDGVFLKRWQRQLFYERLIKEKENPLFIYFVAPIEELKKRVIMRKKTGMDISDADLEVLKYQIDNFEALDELPSFRVCKLKNDKGLENITKNIGVLIDDLRK